VRHRACAGIINTDGPAAASEAIGHDILSAVKKSDYRCAFIEESGV